MSDDLSAQVTEAYRTTLADRARRDVQVRSALLGTLFRTVTSTSPNSCGSRQPCSSLPRTADFVVVTAECPTPGADALPGIEERLRRNNITSAWRVDRDHQDGLIGLTPAYNVDRLLVELHAVARGRVGVSTAFGRVDGAPHARREARSAAASATPGTTDVVRF